MILLQKKGAKLLAISERRPCHHWNSQTNFEPKTWNFHTFMKSMYSMVFLLKDYCSPLGTVSKHVELATRLLLCRRWRMTPRHGRNYNQSDAKGSNQPCTQVTCTSRIIGKQIFAERRLTMLDCQVARCLNDHTPGKVFKSPLWKTWCRVVSQLYLNGNQYGVTRWLRQSSILQGVLNTVA